jgi:hypothetical protein
MALNQGVKFGTGVSEVEKRNPATRLDFKVFALQ